MVAEKLGKTLGELRDQITFEELLLWAAFYELRSQEEKAAIDKAKRRRR
jgi:hypothetical protein